MDAMRVLESNNSSSSSDNNNDQGTKTKPPATRTASLKTRLALLVFAETPLTTHHSLPFSAAPKGRANGVRRDVRAAL